MNKFQDAYDKAIDLLKTKSLDPDWEDIEAGLKALFAADGPDVGKAQVLIDLRDKLRAVAKGEASESGAMADEILKASKAPANGYQDRAALIKLVKHLYFVRKKGNQKIWVYAGTEAYDKWVFDLFNGLSKTDVRAKLKKNTEVFSGENRRLMSDALQLARKWAQDIVVKLGTPDAATRKVIQRWFHTKLATDRQVVKTAKVLHDGFKKICAVCNSTQVIFSDEPADRNTDDDWDTTFASVSATGDKLSVIYIFKLFLDAGKKTDKGKISKLWLCALTIIHELSHREVRTDDIRYDDEGLKPSLTKFRPKSAIKNADTWGYFAADLVGALPAETRKEVYK